MRKQEEVKPLDSSGSTTYNISAVTGGVVAHTFNQTLILSSSNKSEDELVTILEDIPQATNRSFRLEIDSNNLLKKYYLAHSTIRLPVFEIHQSLKDCYINLVLVDEPRQDAEENMPFLKGIYDPKSRPLKPNELYKNMQKKRLLIVGPAGIGKSIFCQYLACDWSSTDVRNRALLSFDTVIRVPLRYLCSYQENLKHSAYKPENICFPTDADIADFLSYVVQEESHAESNELARQLAKTWLPQLRKQQKILWLLDGFDEIAGLSLDSFASNILYQYLLKREYYVLTSRPHAVVDRKDLDVHARYELLGFQDAEIAEYVQTVFRLNREKEIIDSSWSDESEKQFLVRLKKNRKIWNIAHVPIHLVLMCNLQKESAVLFKEEHVSLTMLIYNLIGSLGLRFVNRLDVMEGKRSGGEELEKEMFLAD